MRLPLGRSAVTLTALSAAVAATIAVSSPASSVEAVTAGRAPASAVGALFSLSPAGQLENHFCTASVVDSPAGDLVVTAAHCLAGRAAGTVAFVPGYTRGTEPFGIWTVSQVIEDERWASAADPDDDFAFLVVHQPGAPSGIQEMTGGEQVGIDVAPGRSVTVAGYPDGSDAPIRCENTAQGFSATQYQFDCGGFTDGTSGSPLLMQGGPFSGTATVIGVIGGYERGGLTPSVSYAARFSARLAALYRQALAAARL